MSKLFPIFKRKGRSKEEEGEEEAKKKNGKIGKHSKEHSPSPRTTSAAPKRRKDKAVKRRAPMPNGKENRPLEDSGTAEERPQKLLECPPTRREDFDALESPEGDVDISKVLEESLVTSSGEGSPVEQEKDIIVNVNDHSEEPLEEGDAAGEGVLGTESDLDNIEVSLSDSIQQTLNDLQDSSRGVDALGSQQEETHEGLEDCSQDLEGDSHWRTTSDESDHFDSAQEDWDEDEEPTASSSSTTKKPPKEQEGGVLNDAKNEVLVGLRGDDAEAFELLREPSSSSSFAYQDAEEEESFFGAPAASSPPVEARRGGGGGLPPAGRLTRKMSNLSAASSELFNEELDELLDEELDRLSEQGVEETPNQEPPEGGGGTESALDTVDDAVQRRDFEAVKQDADFEADRVVPALTAATATAPPPSEEPPEQAKDSGYYSLPVSPKPSVPEKVEPEKKAEDSLGESEEEEEEEGMVTPPDEVATPTGDEDSAPGGVDVQESAQDSSAVTESAQDSSAVTESAQDTSAVEESAALRRRSGSAETADGEVPKVEVPVVASGRCEGAGGSSSSSSSSPARQSRHKTPSLDLEKPLDEASEDPVGERFLSHAIRLSHEEAEARLAQRRAARAEARELRLRELEKQQQDQENEDEKQFASPPFAGHAPNASEGDEEADDIQEEEEEEEEGEPSPRPVVAGRAPIRTAGINSTGQYSRRSSEDSTTDESLPANVREMRAELKELDEKFRKAMITNAQLDNEKATLTYEVELMKDRFTELEEVHTQLSKEHRKKCTEYEQLRKVSTKLQEEVKTLRGLLQERDQLIQEYGLVVVGEEEEDAGWAESEREREDDDMDDLTPRKIAVKKALLSQEAAELLEKGAARGSLDVRLKKFGEEKNELEDQVRRLKLELEEERNKNRRRENGLDYEKQKEQNKTVNEYKFRVQKAEAEVSTLQANVARLDALSARYKTQSEELERSEEDLKVEKRKLQRELRDAQSRLEELETTNNHLIKRFDKLKNARSTLLKDLSLDPV